MKNRAYVLGAGPSGLVAAWQLLRQGWSVEIFEKAAQVGGMCRTWKWRDYLVDTGPHIYHTPDSELAAFWEKEFGDLFIKGDFWCKNVKGDLFDQYYDYPLSWESISKYPADLKKQVIRELELRSAENKSRARNYSEYMDAEVGPTLRKMFFEKYPKKIWGISTDDMTADWAPKRIEFRQKVTPFYHNQWNAVGKFGTGCIYDRIKEQILALGGKIHLNTTVVGFDHEGDKLRFIQLKDRSALPLELDDVVISTLPITLTSRLLGYSANLKFRGICSVFLAYDQPEILPDNIHWLYYDSEKVLFNRITENKKLSPHVAPKESSFITAEITYTAGDDLDAMAEQPLIETVAQQCETVGLAPRSRLIAASINKEPFVYPVQFFGFRDELRKAQNVIGKFPQLYSIGTGGEYNYADSQILFHKAFDLVEILTDKKSVDLQLRKRPTITQLNQVIKVGNHFIGENHRPFIIAEAGMNHNGSVNLAKQLIDEAVRIGCSAVKFQTFLPDSRVSASVRTAKYAETITGLEETMAEMFARLAMPFEQQKELFSYAKTRNIEIFSTPFDRESVDFLESQDIGLYKIASMDIVNIPLIKYVAQTNKPTILSTGMSSLGQIEEAVEAFRSAGNPNLILLHCNSSYPAPPEQMNLNVIPTLKSAFRVPVGLSDHTIGLTVSKIAIAIGAQVIERHFTLNKMFEGPDHILSSDPEEMAELVHASHQIPKILGNGIKQIQPTEYDTINSQRRSLLASRDIEKGEYLTRDMLVIKGPGIGLLPKYLDVVIGRPARTRIPKDHPITWETI